MRFLRKLVNSAFPVLAFAMCVAFATELNAQVANPQPQQQEARDDFSSEELENFVEVVKVQQEKEVEMIQAIQDEGLELNRFNEILQVQQNPESTGEGIPEEDLGKFEKASEKVIELQQEMQMVVMQTINDTGLGVQTYQQIMTAYQTNPDVQKEVDALLTK